MMAAASGWRVKKKDRKSKRSKVVATAEPVTMSMIIRLGTRSQLATTFVTGIQAG